MIEIAAAALAVAKMVAAGGGKELAESAGGGLVAGIIKRVKGLFASDPRSMDSLERARQNDQGAVGDLASALAYYARQNQEFAAELSKWAEQAPSSGGVTQNIHAGRDAYTSARDQTITTHNAPEPPK